LVQKRFNFNALRGREGTAESGAFQRRGGGGEPERLPQFLSFGDRERESAMEHVSGAEGVHGVDREGRRLLDGPILVEPDRAPRSPRSRQE
jgi:hypothetical protein